MNFNLSILDMQHMKDTNHDHLKNLEIHDFRLS